MKHKENDTVNLYILQFIYILDRNEIHINFKYIIFL